MRPAAPPATAPTAAPCGMYVTAASKIMAETLSMATRGSVAVPLRSPFIGLPSELCGGLDGKDCGREIGAAPDVPAPGVAFAAGGIVADPAGTLEPEVPVPGYGEPGYGEPGIELPVPVAPVIPG